MPMNSMGCVISRHSLSTDSGCSTSNAGRCAHRVLQHLAGIEVRGRLARRKVREGLRMQLQNIGSGHDRPKLLPGVEREAGGFHMLLERINPEIDRARDSWSHQRPGEPVVLDLKMDLPVLVADGKQVMFPVVEEFMSQ